MEKFYRIPKEDEVKEREFQVWRRARIIRYKMQDKDSYTSNYSIKNLKEDLDDLNKSFKEFYENSKTHIGTHKEGWQFLWEWNEGKFYKTRQELIDFICEGEIENENGDKIDKYQFLDMALVKGAQKDGWTYKTYFEQNPSESPINIDVSDFEYFLDGLRFSGNPNLI